MAFFGYISNWLHQMQNTALFECFYSVCYLSQLPAVKL